MTATVVVAPLIVALLSAVVSLLTRPSDRLTRAVSLLGGLGYLLAVAALFRAVVLPTGTPSRALAYQASGWAAPFGISLVADALSAFMLGLAGLVSFAGVAFAVLHVDSYGQRLTFHPLYHFMIAGVTGSFLTGDLFNLFVWFEVMLMASYVLVLFYGGPRQTRAGLYYVVLNLVGGVVMLLAVGGLYATTGTLNMADMARRLADPAAYGVSTAPILGLAGLLLAVFALKAGLVPFHFWVPGAYRAAPAPVTAVLAGVVKKVGVYAIIRLYFTVVAAASFPGGLGLPGVAGDSALALFGPVLFLMAAASVLLGGVGAVGRDELDELLAYSSISQIGFVVLPLAVAATAPAVRTLGVLAALVYAFNHGLAKGLLFLVSGADREAVGTTRFAELGGLAPRLRAVSAGFFVGMLALIGVPPLVGFFGKFAVFGTAARAYAVGAAGGGLALAVALGGAVLTIAYYTRAWNAVFWGEPTTRVRTLLGEGGLVSDGGDAPDRGPEVGAGVGGASRDPAAFAGEVTLVLALAAAVVGFGVGFEAVHAAADAAARAAVDTGAYVRAVAPAEVSE
jgi:multicomponent Na+:H+ antiporter subunit D